MAETKSDAGQSGGRFPLQLHFSRGLSPWQAVARGLGVILSATFFSLLGHATTAVGSLTPLALLLAGLLITANGLGYAELAVAGRRSGGAYALIHEERRSAWLAFAAGWSLTLAGLGLALGNAGVAGGAFLLFVTNIAAIGLAGGILFLLLGVRPRIWGPESRRRLCKRLVVSSLLLAAIAVPLCLLMAGTLQDAAQEQAIRQVLAERFSPNEVQVVDVSTRQESTGLAVEVTLRATHPLDRAAVEDLADVLSERLERPVNLAVTVLPTINAWGR